MDSHGLLDDQTVLDQLADVLPGVRVRDLVDLVWVEPDLEDEDEDEDEVEPDLVLAALHDAGGQALLQPERTHGGDF